MTYSEVTDFLNRVGDLAGGQGKQDFLLFVGERIGTMAEGHARAGYPPEPNGRPLELFYTRTTEAKKPYKLKSGLVVGRPGEQFKSKFKSLKQQRKVIMLAKQGKFPRPRSGQLGNSMTHHVSVADGGVIVAVGTNLSYAQVVIGLPEAQSHYHTETGWQPLAETLGAHTADYSQEILTSGKPWLSGYLRGR